MAGQPSASGAAARDVKMKISWVISSNPLAQANKQVDESIIATKKLSDATDRAKKSQDEFGNSTQRSGNEQRQNSQQTQTATDKMKQLNQQLELSKSALRAQTAGLSDMGREADATKIKASALSNIFDLQRQKVVLLRQQYAEMKSSANASADALHNMRVKINDETAALGTLQGKLAVTNNSFKNAADKYKNIGDNMRSAGSGMTQSMGMATMAVGGGLFYVSKQAADFQQAMSNTKSVMDPADVQKYSGALEKLAIVQGAKTKYSATEAAQAEGELLKAGVSVSNVMNGALAGSLNLATSGELGLKDAAEIASTALNSFRKDHLSVAKAANILAGAANASATDVGELKFSLSAVSAVAAGVGLSFKDTSTALAVFAQNGLKGQDAGTSLKTMLSNLTPMTNTAYDEFVNLGLMTMNTSKAMQALRNNGVKPLSSDQADLNDQLQKLAAKLSGSKEGSATATKEFIKLASSTGAIHSAFYNTNGQMKSMADIAQILQSHLKNLNGEQRQQALYTIFGSDAIRGANILFREGAKGVTDMAGAMDKIKASDVAAQKMNNLKGDIEQLNGSVQTASISLGNGLTPAIDWTTKGIQRFVDWFNKLSPAMQHVVAIGGAVTLGAVGIATATGIMAVAIGTAIRGFSDVYRVLGRMTGRTAESTAALKMQRDEMVKNTVAAEAMAKAENNAANTGGGLGGGVSGGSSGPAGSSSTGSRRRGLFSRIFRRGGASAAASVGEEAAQSVSGGGRLLRFAGTAGKVVGGGVIGLDVLTSATSLIGMNGSNAGSKLGDFGGTLAGGAIGAAIGSVIAPGVGTAIGGALGSWLGGSGGKWIGSQIQGAIDKTDPTKKLEKGALSATKAYEDDQGKIDTRFKMMAASGSSYSEKMKNSINKAYDSILTNAGKAARSQETASKKNLDYFVRNGYLTKSQADKDLQVLKDNHHSQIAEAQSATNALKKLNDRYYADVHRSTNQEEKVISSIKKTYSDKNGNISLQGQKMIYKIEKGYSADRTQLAQEYESKRTKIESSLKSAVVKTISQSAVTQRIILGKLKDDSGKLSVQQASDIVKQAKRARDGSVSEADKKYKEVLAKADKEYYGTGDISKKQYDAIVKTARQQRDDSVKAANDQWHQTVSAAKSQAKDHASQIDWETGKVLSGWDKMGNGILSAWNWIKSIFSGTSQQGHLTDNSTRGLHPTSSSSGASAKTATQGYGTHGMVAAVAHAKGTSGHPGGHAILGDGGKPELWITPQGKAGISPSVPTLYRNMPAGTQVLNGNDTEQALSMNAYANGTGGFWSSIGDFLGNGFDWIKSGAASATNWVLNKFHLGNVGNLGDLTKLTQDTAWPAVKNLFSNGMSNLAKSFGNTGNPSGAGVQRWSSYVVKALQMNGLSTSAGMVAKVLRQIATESGGNPNAIQHGYTDVNTLSGNLARGLMQVIPPTFNAYKFPGHNNPMNGLDSLLAGLNYAKHRYGSSLSFLGQGHGYENGGISMTEKLAHISEGNKPEAVVPLTKPSRALQVINRAKQMMGLGGERHLGGQPANITFSPTVNINVDGSKGDISEEKLARRVRQELEKLFNELRKTHDLGWEY